MNHESFDKILERNRNLIFRFCKIYAINEEDQKDLFQEIAFNVWKALPNFKGTSKMSTWIYKIAMRVALSYSKKQKKNTYLQLDFLELDESFVEAEFLEKKEQLNQLRFCINELNEVDKLLVSLYLEDWPYSEISSLMGISENLVAVKMKRVKTKLFNCLNQ